MFVMAFHDTYGMPINITRCSNNYGPYQFPEKLIPLRINNVKHHKQLPVDGDGMQIRDWLYVEDHCKAIDMVCNGGKIGEVYNAVSYTHLALHRAGVDANPFTVAARQADLLVVEDPAWVEMPAQMPGQVPVSYTHLDVYKRQTPRRPCFIRQWPRRWTSCPPRSRSIPILPTPAPTVRTTAPWSP